MVFVYGSNLAGKHGAGAAVEALRRHGARIGIGYGRQGNSFGIPTKDANLRPLPLQDIADTIQYFIEYARCHSEEPFQITRIGCGRAGFTSEQIAPLFAEAPDNCQFDSEWSKYLPNKKFWGTFRTET